MSAFHTFCAPTVFDCQGLKMYRNKSTTAQWKAWRQTRSHAGLFISLLILFSFSMSLKATKAKSPLPFPSGYFCLMLFTSPLCDVTPVVCQTEGRRCLMRPPFFFFFHPDSSSLAFIFILFVNEAHPLSAATQLFSASDGSVGVRAYHSSPSLSLSVTCTHILYFSLLPPS